jgi:hypothetical protein
VHSIGSVSVSLSGCVAKLERARVHQQELDRRVLRFIEEEQPYRQVCDPAAVDDSGMTEVIARLTHDVIEPPSDEWAPIIGDFAHNLRSALDHLVCQLSIANEGDPDCRRTQFPILRADGIEAHQALKRDIGSLAFDDQLAIRSLQPYAQAWPATGDRLWQLHDLNNIDKHRRLHLVTVGIFGGAMVGRDVELVEFHELGGHREGDPIVRAKLRVRGTPPSTVLRIATGIRFGPGSGAVEGESVRSFLPYVFEYVCSKVFGSFARRVGDLPSGL